MSYSGPILPMSKGGSSSSLTPSANSLVYSSASGMALLATANSAFLLTNASGVPALSVTGSITQAAGGEINWPLQPAFLAILSTNATDVTGDGTIVTVIPDTEIFDRNSDYNNATGVFTAPVSGRYALNAQVYCQQLGVANTVGVLNIVTSNRTYVLDLPHLISFATRTWTLNVLADMDSGDTASVTLGVYGSTKTVDFLGNATTAFTSFSGYLVS